MKHRIAALFLCLGICLPFCACASESKPGPSLLNGTINEYSHTVAYATTARGGVDITESAAGHILKNRTARLDFGTEEDGLKSLISLQTGETLLKNTFTTLLTAEDGRTATVTGGQETVEQGQYGISHHRTEGALSLPALPTEAQVLKEYDLTGGAASDFSALKNELSAEKTDTGLVLTSQGGHRAQFGARYLGVDLEEHDRYYLSVSVKSAGISGLKCFFSTDATPLTEDTVLGTLKLTEGESVTLTAPIENAHWTGKLQTLLFRLPEGESGTVEISRVAILAADNTLDEGVADTLWTVYSDRIYFSQVLRFNDKTYQKATTTVTVDGAKCLEVIESEHAVGLKMIDGSVFGLSRPTEGATLRVEKSDGEIRLIFDWDLSGTPMLATRVYLNYTDTAAELEALAQQERNPLSAENFELEGATFDRYDPRGGMYRLTRTGSEVSVTVKANDRTLYFHLLPAEDTAWKLCDKEGSRLPVFAGATFPICSEGAEISVTLKPEQAPQILESPAFFPESGLHELSRSTSILNGLCARNTVVYTDPDGAYTVTLTATRLNGGQYTVYDIRYDFLGRKHVSDLLSAFPFFSFELTYGFDEYFYLNSENETVTAPAGNEEVSYLGGLPYVGLKGDTEAAGWLVTKSTMTAGGEASTALPALRYREVSEGDTNRLFLSFDAGETDFVRGDTLTAQVIRVENGQPTEETLKALRTAGNLRLIQTEQKSAGTVTATGIEASVILCLEGFEDYRFPSLTVDGQPFTPEYRVYVDEKGYYAFAFSVATGMEITVE